MIRNIKVLFQNFCFKNPPKSDIVIFDETNSKFVSDYILDNLPYYIYETRPKIIFISLKVIYYFIKSLQSIDCKYVVSKNKKFRALFGELSRHYYLSCFQLICPKIVITNIDNSGWYHWLSKKYIGAEFFAIQNGHRTNEQLKKSVQQYHQHFFCFGEYDKSKYERFGHSVLNCYPIGSLKLGIYDHYYKMDNKIIYDFSIVSQFRTFTFDKHSALNPDEKRVKTSQIKMYNYLSKYIQKKKIKACIILSSDQNNEIKWFRNIFHDNVDYIPNNAELLLSYKALQMSKISIGFNSTLISEAMCLNNKILRIDFTESSDFNEYKPMILLNNPTYQEMSERLDQLLAEPYDSYRKRTKEYASYVMNYDPCLPPHIYIRKKIEEYL